MRIRITFESWIRIQNRIRVKSLIRISIIVKIQRIRSSKQSRGGVVDAHHGGLKAQNGALEGLWTLEEKCWIRISIKVMRIRNPTYSIPSRH
jgi:hypothetical protein